LIAVKDIDLNRPPFFIIKGRRITEIAKVDNFRTSKKSAIWSRPNVTGYIDVSEVLTPNPTRKDFLKTDLSKALFNTLLKVEGNIKDYIDSESEINLCSKFNDFEHKINSALNLFFSKTQVQDDFKNITNGVNEYTFLGYRTVNRRSCQINKIRSRSTTSISKPRVERKRNHKFTIKFPNDSPEDSNSAGNLSVKIDSDKDPYKSIDGQPLRSILIDSSIIIFSKHVEFESRITHSRKGFMEINPRIIQYISLEIITHVINNSDPEEIVGPAIYNKFVTSVLKLESELKYLIGERL
jgi:hypothetical protein